MAVTTSSEKPLHMARIVSSMAATAISLACGTNYVYSAWGPQFADKLKLSSTQQNLIGASGNLGMYSMGIPIGMFVDTKGPRPAVISGALLLGAGYFPLHMAYDRGGAPIPLLCIFSFLTGAGGCAAFAAAIKTSALNWPHHRGTATAFPLAAFGLSAFFFSIFAHILPGNTGHFLLVLAYGTFGLVLVSFFFLRVLPYPHYSSNYAAVSGESDLERASSNPLLRTRSKESKYRAQHTVEPGMSASTSGRNGDTMDQEVPGELATETGLTPETETSSLISKSSSSAPGDIDENVSKDHAHRVDIRGFKMLPFLEFWQLFLLMGILAGIGLMTINNIGNDAQALWRHYDDSISEDFINQQQATHVSILSVCSFVGRLLSGVGSDFLVKVLRASRLWCLTIASVIFLGAQLFALNTENPNFLYLVSGMTGLAYGFLFGCFPSLVAEAFGIHGLSTNWGFMTLSPIFSANLFNLFYGAIYDKHSIIEPSGERECTEGLYCYRSAYVVTLFACVLGLVVSLWSIWFVYRARQREEKLRRHEERGA